LLFSNLNSRAKFFFVTLLCFLLLAPLLGCGEDPAKVRFADAERLAGDGYFESAIGEYYRVIESHPESKYTPMSYYKIGLTYHRFLGNREKAIDIYSTLFFLHPDSPASDLAREDRAKIFSSQEKHRRAIEDYDILLQSSTPEKMAEYQYLIALEYISINDFMQARIEFNEILAREVDKSLLPEIYYNIATTYYLEGSLDDAIETFDKVITDYPRTKLTIEARLSKGIALGEAGYLDEAINELMLLAPVYHNPEALAKRIELLEERKKTEPTLTKWEKKYLEKDKKTIAEEEEQAVSKEQKWREQRVEQLELRRKRALERQKAENEAERKALEAAKLKEEAPSDETATDVAGSSNTDSSDELPNKEDFINNTGDVETSYEDEDIKETPESNSTNSKTKPAEVKAKQ